MNSTASASIRKGQAGYPSATLADVPCDRTAADDVTDRCITVPKYIYSIIDMRMNRLRVVGIVIVWLLGVASGIGGCMRTTPLFVAVDPPSGHPQLESGGLPVQVRFSGGEPPYSINFGDGTEISTSANIAEHTYSAPFAKSSYRVVVSCEGGGRGSASVSIENEAPVFHGIFSVKDQRAAEREMILLQVNHFTKGCRDCPSCDPYQVFGGEDPDGDALHYVWHISKDGSSQEDSVFDLSGRRVNGEPATGDYFVWFPMWQENVPLFPLGVAQQALTSDVYSSHRNPFTLPAPKGFYFSYTISVTVIDYCGASNTFTTKWEVLEHDN